jgi:hypothetical protein
MARRKHSIAIYGAEATAKRTIEHLKEKVQEAKVNPSARSAWIEKYFHGIEDYADNRERLEEAERKLETWYEVLETDVAPEFSKAMSKARSEYYKRLAEKYSELSKVQKYVV